MAECAQDANEQEAGSAGASASASLAAARNVIYRSDLTMTERYGPKGGQIWEDGVWADFEDKDGPITIPWYDEKTGAKNIIAADENRPLQMATVEEYKEGILSDGLNQGSRGAPWMQWGPGKTFPVRALTWNHLRTAFYKAHAEHPENAFVQIALKAGLKKARMLYSGS